MNSSDDNDDLEYQPAAHREPEVCETMGGCAPVVMLCAAVWVLVVVVYVKFF